MSSLIVIGSAPCAKADLAAFLEIVRDSDLSSRKVSVMAIGLDAVNKFMGQVAFVATNHPEDIPEIKKRRQNAGGNIDYLVVSPLPGPGIDMVEPYRPPSGSSAITGTLAGIRIGYEKIILCGCPLTGNAPEGNSYAAFREGWTVNREAFGDKVRSMSGWTREFLGAPTKEWFGD